MFLTKFMIYGASVFLTILLMVLIEFHFRAKKAAQDIVADLPTIDSYAMKADWAIKIASVPIGLIFGFSVYLWVMALRSNDELLLNITELFAISNLIPFAIVVILGRTNQGRFEMMKRKKGGTD